MALWGKINRANNAPKFAVIESQVASSPSRGTNAAFNNTSVGVFHGGQTIGVFGANATQVAATEKISHTGWQLVRQGTGPVANLTINAGGTGYANLAVGTISGGETNAQFQVLTTNSTGGILTLALTNAGKGFANVGSLTVTYPANGVLTFAIGGGSGYSNGEAVRVSNGQVNATGVLVTNATGGITAVTLSSAGRGFSSNTNSVVTITTANGTNGNVVVSTLATGASANVTARLSGRAGRMHYETLVAGSITGSPPATLP